MSLLNTTNNPNVLVGLETGDDAGVWNLGDGRALISTVDFITPVVNDARTWGRIAAANSLSDVYAMGGTPLFGLNLVAWNNDELPTELLSEVLQGGLLPGVPQRHHSGAIEARLTLITSHPLNKIVLMPRDSVPVNLPPFSPPMIL